MEEIWRPVVGYEDLYEVNTNCFVRRIDSGHIQQKTDNRYNRHYCHLWRNNNVKTKWSYIVGAQAFPEICGEWFEGCEVHHKDFNRLNDNIYNLQITSVAEHRKLHSESEITKQRLSESHKGQVAWNKGKHTKSGMEGKYHSKESKQKMRENSPLKKPVIMCNSNGDILNMFESIIEAERQTGINDSNISACCNKKPHFLTAGGFYWEYL